MDKELENKIKEFHQGYLIRAKEVYGELPQRCFETKFVIGTNPTDKLSSGADSEENIIYIHPDIIDKTKNKDLEWTIYHEMEHIRLYRNLKEDRYRNASGFHIAYEYGSAEALNEGLTEISVGQLLGRKQKNSYGYYETTQLVRQIFSLLGLEDKQIITYCALDGRERFIEDFKILAGGDVFAILDIGLQSVHDNHIADINKEYIEFGEIKVKPLGMYCSESTQKSRITFRNLVLGNIIKFIAKNGKISKEELNKRVQKLEELSPYQNGELEIETENLSL